MSNLAALKMNHADKKLQANVANNSYEQTNWK
jgi:hypothetical protein